MIGKFYEPKSSKLGNKLGNKLEFGIMHAKMNIFSKTVTMEETYGCGNAYLQSARRDRRRN